MERFLGSKNSSVSGEWIWESGITDGPGFPSRMPGQVLGYSKERANEVGLCLLYS